MRLHRLEVEAFGPFATREVVDFDALSGDGVFLLHGPTGAGKTSLLDAVCFALFGQLPGARREGRPRLRSDHAEPAVAPRVVLELTIGERRLEVTRSPEWQRPKKRGSGTTREPASTDVRELVGGEWQVVVARRSDEAALLLHDLLGMGLEQFTKVVMLPQGEFAAFLRAGAEQRADLLSRLFDIDRYSGVEAWLREERQQLTRRVAAADAEQDALVARAQQAALPVVGGIATVAGSPEELALADPPGPALVDALTATVDRALRGARSAVATAQEQAETTAAAWRSAQEVAQRLDRRTELLAVLAGLESDAERQQAAVDRLTAARQAQRLTGVLPRLAAAEAAVARARDVVTGRRASLPASLADARAVTPSSSDDATPLVEPLEAALDRRSRELTRLDDAQAQDDELHELRTQCADLSERAEHEGRAVAELSARLPLRQAALEQLRERERTLVARAAMVEAARAAVDAARTTAAAAAELEECTRDLAAQEDRRRDARDLELQAQAHLLDIRERRLRGMAAALAAGLAEGDPCPVCGGVDHPHLAPTAPDHVDEVEERLAQEQADVASGVREAADATFAEVAQRHAALIAAAAGLTAQGAQAALSHHQHDLAEAQRAAEQLVQCRRQLETEQAEHDAATDALRVAQRRHDDHLTRLEVLTARRDEVAGALATLLQGADSLAARRQQVTAERQALGAVLDAVRDLVSAATHADDLRRAAGETAGELGFTDLDAAQRAWLDDDELAALEQSVREHERLRADTHAVLATAELCDLEGVPAPDLDGLGAAAEQAARQCAEAVRALTIAQHAHAALVDLAEELREHDDVHRELRARHRRVDELSRCVDGTGGGNVRRMRLSAFVLAARLEEVAAAASERLLAMSDGRYTLTHSDDLAKGGARSGLGLQVVDSWTGVAREPATLSGGESFIASLALALGLADVVQAEAGGTDIETLFVDEGFGSLDDYALEEVMSVLDGLRSGGRTVGIVSHVGDLRSRIHQQLEVVKTRTGSSVRQRLLDTPERAVS
ncbi:MAG: AAA family ATPase [Angustibacter sp.]